MNYPFLTNVQVEELREFGMIDVTEDMLESMMEYFKGDNLTDDECDRMEQDCNV